MSTPNQSIKEKTPEPPNLSTEQQNKKGIKIKVSDIAHYLLWLAISTTNSCHYYVACLSPITINNCCFHFLQMNTSNLMNKVGKGERNHHKKGRSNKIKANSKKPMLFNMQTLSSLILMSFISSGNLSTPALWPLDSLKPDVGAKPTEAISKKSLLTSYHHKRSFTWPP